MPTRNDPLPAIQANGTNSKDRTGATAASDSAPSGTLTIPSISLPKGGGAIKQIDEKFSVNAVNGTAAFSIPLPVSDARGFAPSVALNYDSGSGNGVFGMGWTLSLSSIKRKTAKKLPQYIDDVDADIFLISGNEDLVPEYQKDNAGNFIPDGHGGYQLHEYNLNLQGTNYRVRRYRPRIEGAFVKIERWKELVSGLLHWRVVSTDNVTSIYGKTANARIADPANGNRVFEWMLEFAYDDKGNCCYYEYKPEDQAGLNAALAHNQNRVNGNAPFTNTYLKRIWHGNTTPYTGQGGSFPAAAQFLFETTFDYGEHYSLVLPFLPIQPWDFRADAFSFYQPGFEVRTCRQCRRVLLYHHFAELPGGTALVRALQFSYEDNGSEGFSFLTAAQLTGYTKQDDGTYTQRSLPPFTFSYQKFLWDASVHNLNAADAPNLPVGIDDSNYLFVDLYNEGLSGVLTEQAAAWLYKHNLGGGHFTPAAPVLLKPSFVGLRAGLQLLDLDANGTRQMVKMDEEPKGYFELNDDGSWAHFHAFEGLPNIDLHNPNTRMVDLNGDGMADVLITEDEVLTWYPSRGRKGFDSALHTAKARDEELGPAGFFADEKQSFFLADMSGDGLQDIVRIRNGSVCYWPNLGYGRFGARVAMDHAPLFDYDDQFNASFLKLADIDGSGIADIVYLAPSKCTIWMNLQGNAFSTVPKVIDGVPATDALSKVDITDLLGTGLSCIVWSSPLAKDQGICLRYIDLMQSRKPHLMQGYRNNMGKEVALEYTPSTSYYVQDMLAGTPWITKLHFPVHCVSKMVQWNRIMKTRFASTYSYHHGYYDHFEKEFRGFGRVDQQDAEDIAHYVLQGGSNATIEQDLHQAPVLTKSWFHTGAFLDREQLLGQYAHEYFVNTMVPENALPEPVLPPGLSLQEYREALRACKGTLLRKEVYALDASADQQKPYQTEQHNVLIKLLQPSGGNAFAVFLTHESEAITYQYERNPADPRVAHRFIFAVDDFGNVRESASLVYPRTIDPLPAPEQKALHLTYTENSYTNAIDTAFDYRTPRSAVEKTYEVSGLPAPVGYYRLTDLQTACHNAAVIDFEVVPDGTLQKRLIDFSRTQYRANDTVTALPFGTIDSKGLVHQSFRAACNDALLTGIFAPKMPLATLVPILTDPARGAYVFADNYYWIPSATCNYDAANFFHSTQYTDPFGNQTQVQYDAHQLFVQRTIDAAGNESAVDLFNYRTLQPMVMKDPNDNRSAVRFDELGLVISSFAIGKKGIDAGDVFDDTHIEPQNAVDYPGATMQYSVSEWYDQTQGAGFDITNYKPHPNFVRTRTRETHYRADLLHRTRWQEAYAWFDGAGHVVLRKAQAEPGPALRVNPDGSVTYVPDTTPNLRWTGNGRTIVNNKGNAVKQYEPYFSTAPVFDDEQDMVQLGVTSIVHYDPLDRVVRKDMPNKTFTRQVFNPWMQQTFDANDTVMDSEWYQAQGSPNPAGAEPSNANVRAAWLAAKQYNTPTTAHLDSMGRTFMVVTTDGSATIQTRTTFDIKGKPLSITDGLNRTVMQYDYDMQGNALKQTGMDAGNRWHLNDAAGKPLLAWDDKGRQFTMGYDSLQRPAGFYVLEGGATTLFHKTVYGESLPVATAKNNNLLTKDYLQYDPSGIVTHDAYDFKGNLLLHHFQMAAALQGKIDWTNVAAVALHPDVFEERASYDALSRPILAIAPHRPADVPSTISPSYNEAGLLEQVNVSVKGAAPVPFVTNINYNAKAQRESIYYGNGTKTAYTYDPYTFRLVRLLTTRNNGAVVLQDLNYTYDPVGNITQMQDNAQSYIFFDGELAKALNKYEYDALYRLVKASGRKHAGQTDINERGIGNPPDFRNHSFGPSVTINPNDAQAFRNYSERYQYDNAGNMQLQQHTAKNSSWTRTFEYDNGLSQNNHLTATTLGADTFHYTYDAHGNMQGLETIGNERWDFLDLFREANLGGGGTASYVYNAGGQRTRKVIDRLDGSRKERIYLGAVELYREYDAGGHLLLERETLHVMDDKQRIAMVDTPTLKPAGSHEIQLIRYQYSNHQQSAALELDETAQVISYEEYFPFGTTAYATIDATREVAAKRYRYTGKERDEESGLNYHGARYYAPWLCRWTKADPIDIKGGLNFYSYVGNNPVMMHDPSGNDGEVCGVWDEERQACYNEPCPVQSSVNDTPSTPPPVPTPPRVRYVPKRPPPPPPVHQPPPPPPPVSPTDYTLYVGEGFAYQQYRAAAREVDDPNNPWYVRGGFFVLGSAAAPLALAEEYIARPLVNVPFTMHNAGIHIGEHIGRAYLWSQQGEYGEMTVDILSSVQSGSEGFVAGASVALPLSGGLESRAASTTTRIETQVLSPEAESFMSQATEVRTSTARLDALANVADSGQVRWVAGDQALFDAYTDAMAAGRSTATGRAGFNLLRNRMGSRVTLTGPIHHWRFPISTFSGEAMAGENLYMTQGTSHLGLHRAIGVAGNPYGSMAWGAEPEIQNMFNFWLAH